jgi:hypothetical protein
MRLRGAGHGGLAGSGTLHGIPRPLLGTIRSRLDHATLCRSPFDLEIHGREGIGSIMANPCEQASCEFIHYLVCFCMSTTAAPISAPALGRTAPPMLKNSLRVHIRRLVSVVSASAAMIIFFVLNAPPAQALVPNCSGDGTYLSEIRVKKDGDGNFIIVATPTEKARQHSGTSLSQRNVVVKEWHAIQACVSGLYGDLADSIWQQLECHQRLAWAVDPRTKEWLTGPDYDLESWRPKLAKDNIVNKVVSKCGGYLGADLDEELFSNPYRPDAGATDLEHAYDNIA